ncbi:hypothetical protein Zm00014a_023679 [Zea mays]|jgi:hypothetical protein|uniref:Uncharacterized protein n=2 Tax=Zea mays TaxID=4577 RepID=B6T0C7_MAIZE|nr:uncharacterized protein LOC100275872 precursor [Zea mays]ACG30560.1 hypothetical protein [Zea mays]AQK46793.1 hypothetical protein ZEAMMB73_Zm00001d026498 [Zea mays]PWZ44277.1 hypothetical protein Zm00014a_023679 [Zea mays]|eukprot:NP_001143310.1 uncharacterized protein LOC100275872 precursor [Zea mays]
MRSRRWSRAAVLAWLVLVAAAACVADESRAVPAARNRTGTGTAAVSVRQQQQQRGAFDVVVAGLVSIGLGRRWRAGGMVDEDKRRVPTGPNPLHNR